MMNLKLKVDFLDAALQLLAVKYFSFRKLNNTCIQMLVKTTQIHL